MQIIFGSNMIPEPIEAHAEKKLIIYYIKLEYTFIETHVERFIAEFIFLWRRRQVYKHATNTRSLSPAQQALQQALLQHDHRIETAS